VLEESGGLDPQRSCAQPVSSGRRPPVGSLSNIGGVGEVSIPTP
jgi:hypothetical protein